LGYTLDAENIAVNTREFRSEAAYLKKTYNDIVDAALAEDYDGPPV
jgi:hypothetical protein